MLQLEDQLLLLCLYSIINASPALVHVAPFCLLHIINFFFWSSYQVLWCSECVFVYLWDSQFLWTVLQLEDQLLLLCPCSSFNASPALVLVAPLCLLHVILVFTSVALVLCMFCLLEFWLLLKKTSFASGPSVFSMCSCLPVGSLF